MCKMPLIPSLASLRGEVQTIDLIMGYRKPNTSKLPKRFQLRADGLVRRGSQGEVYLAPRNVAIGRCQAKAMGLLIVGLRKGAGRDANTSELFLLNACEVARGDRDPFVIRLHCPPLPYVY